MSDSPLAFAQGLLDAIQSKVPPSIAIFKGLPTCSRGKKLCGIYVLVSERVALALRSIFALGQMRLLVCESKTVWRYARKGETQRAQVKIIQEMQKRLDIPATGSDADAPDVLFQ